VYAWYVIIPYVKFYSNFDYSFACPSLSEMVNFLVCSTLIPLYVFIDIKSVVQWEIQFGLASHAFVDVLLAGTMCYYLQIGRTGISA